MIKRLSTIFTSLLLSAMIVSLSAGVAFVHCCCMGTTEMMQPAAAEALGNARAADCCHQHAQAPSCDRNHSHLAMAQCMNVQVVKLNPFNLSQQLKLQLPAVVKALPFDAFKPAAIVPQASAFAIASNRCETYVSPPRSYLRLLRTLLL